MGTLLVVESPAKARTLQRLLGSGFQVRASAGHVKDLPTGRLGVDVDRGFAPDYVAIPGKARVLSDLKRAARGAERVLLATDPDREGEAIAWHVAEELGAQGGDARVRRVLLYELTPEAVARALAAPRDLDRGMFESQQARRILDRLVGYQASPVLWRSVRRGLSAGRVQSVAVRLVVEREREVAAFVPEAWGTLEAELAGPRPPAFRASLVRLDGREVRLPDRAAAEALAAALGGAAFTVRAVEGRERVRPPPPPFTTAKLQQEAARWLGFTPRKTMTLAQRLYEGVELGEAGVVGLITYMRTDSVRLSTQAVDAVRAHVAARFGPEHLPERPNAFKGNPRAQEAHEAVRPTSLEWTPERVAAELHGAGERDLARLYALVFTRFVACQMRPAVYDRTVAHLEAGRAGFRATGAVLRFPGWLAAHGDRPPDGPVSGEGTEAAEGGEGAAAALERPLPPLEAGQVLRLEALVPGEDRTAPPPRFDEPALVRELEERGIGRPSTFAGILDAIQEKGYVERQDRTLRPTALGVRVTDELVRAFPRELDAAFTAAVEDRLDRVAEGAEAWQAVLGEFWAPFRAELTRADAAARGAAAARETDVPCARCGRAMVVRWGRAGEFLACPGYPACRHTLDFRRDAQGRIVTAAEEPPPAEPCPLCGGPMVSRRGRHGPFHACARYPECRGVRAPSIGVACPRGCGGTIGEKRSRMGKAFYGCSGYPACDFVSWDRPRNEPCPRCGSPYLVERFSRKTGPLVACPSRECGWQRDAPPDGSRPA